MDSSNPSFNSSSEASLLQHDRLSSVRRTNKTLILVFFSLIILLALIIGGIIISLVRKNNSQSQSLNPNPAIREFCSPSYSQFSCINSLSSTIKTQSNANPNQIFVLSLETCRKELSNIISMASNQTGPEPDFRNCSSSLGHAMDQLNNILGIMRVNPDVETQTYEQRGDMTAWINVAAEDLESCAGDLGKVESTAVDGVRAKVLEVEALVGFSKEFLVNCDGVNENFRFALANDKSSIDQIVENLVAVSFFGSQYFVLVLLFCLLLRIY